MLTSTDLPFVYVERITIPLAEWYLVQDNPRQRDTQRHAERSDHLHEYSPEQQIVKMALLPDGTKYKLDGHTRAYLWEVGEVVPAFDTVMVDVFSCRDLEAAKLLYGHFDNKAAVETGVHLLQGALRECNIVFQSKFMSATKFGTALRSAYGYVRHCANPATKGLADTSRENWHDPVMIYSAAHYFRDALMKLDAAEPTANKFSSGMIMGALFTLARRDFDAQPFWQSYQRDTGVKDADNFDPVQGLVDVHRRVPKNGGKQTLDISLRAVGAVEAWRAGQLYKVGGPGVKKLSDETTRAFLRKLPRP